MTTENALGEDAMKTTETTTMTRAVLGVFGAAGRRPGRYSEPSPAL
jgi:hypothetical protein